MKNWVSLAFVFCACVQAADFPTMLGQDKSVAGDVTGLAPRAPQSLIDAAALGYAAESLNTARLYAGLKAVKPDLPLRTRGAREVEIYARLSTATTSGTSRTTT